MAQERNDQPGTQNPQHFDTQDPGVERESGDQRFGGGRQERNQDQQAGSGANRQGMEPQQQESETEEENLDRPESGFGSQESFE